LVAFQVRRALEETPVFTELSKHQKAESQLANNFKDPEIRKKMFLLFFCVSSSGAILFFCVQVYTSIFLKTAVKLPWELADQLSIYATIALLPLTIFAGWLSDRIGRKPVIISGLLLGSLFIQPAFLMLKSYGEIFIQTGDHNSLLIITLILGVLSLALALVVGPQTAFLAELFPAKNRNSAATLPHNLAAGWIGGLLPLIVTWINQRWDNNMAGLWYPTVFLSLAALMAIMYLPETRKINLKL
jgi:MFS family permease